MNLIKSYDEIALCYGYYSSLKQKRKCLNKINKRKKIIKSKRKKITETFPGIVKNIAQVHNWIFTSLNTGKHQIINLHHCFS